MFPLVGLAILTGPILEGAVKGFLVGLGVGTGVSSKELVEVLWGLGLGLVLLVVHHQDVLTHRETCGTKSCVSAL